MDPKFQSSFIPKGPAAPSNVVFRGQPAKRGTLLGLISKAIFLLSIVGAGLLFAYGFYLDLNIKKMGGDLEVARQSLEPETIMEMSRLNSRITGTTKLLSEHVVLSPLFDFLEDNTLRTVRFTEFEFNNTEEGLSLSMRGQSRGYVALALQSDLFNKSQYLKSVDFSNLDLDERGNVIFVVNAVISPNLISYKRLLESGAIVPQPAVVGTSTPATTPLQTSTTSKSVLPQPPIN